MDPRNILISDFDYDLPDERIALHPLERRDGCRMLVSLPDGEIRHSRFYELPAFLNPGSLMVVNETKVIRARMEFFKSTGSRIEIFLLEPFSPPEYVSSFASAGKCTWLCMVGNLKRWKSDVLEKYLEIPGVSVPVKLEARLGDTISGNSREVIFTWDVPDISFATIVEHAGSIPIPPYLKRNSEASDTEDYQTVYSHTEGSVAAPTAGLHFTSELMSNLISSGIEIAEVTLHVGAGTFQPVKSEEIGDHPMHEEWISVGKATIVKLIEALKNGLEIVAVGTTSVRTLESLPYFGALIMNQPDIDDPQVTQWMPYMPEYQNIDTVKCLQAIVDYLDHNGLDCLEATTSIMIAPGFRWRIVKRLITNFHQPKSTLLLLVSSFLDPHDETRGQWKKVYEEAISKDYRFLSYGDACLFSPFESRRAAVVALPPSKSIALRQTVIDALASGSPQITFTGGSCDDIDDLMNAVTILKSAPEGEETPVRFRLGAAPVRFFLALAASSPGKIITIDADPHLKLRPISPLIEALRQAGADIVCLEDEGSLPVKVTGKKLSGGIVDVSGNISSQYLSALLLVSPSWEKGAQIKIRLDQIVSASYAEMTLRMMADNGVKPEVLKDQIIVSSGAYSPVENRMVEPDWSAAAFFYETALLMPERVVEIENLTQPENSLQGDSKCYEIFERIGVDTLFKEGSCTLTVNSFRVAELLKTREMLTFDLSSTPDLAPALAVAMALRGIHFRLEGISTLRKKESNRVQSISNELYKLGYILKETEDSLSWKGEKHKPEEKCPEISTYADHRIAMAFAPAEALGLCKVKDKDVVSKSYPGFWEEFHKVTGE